jgi:hypothetical protein
MSKVAPVLAKENSLERDTARIVIQHSIAAGV